MIKPSERIKEFFDKDTTHQGIYKNFFALVEFLDEEWEKNKPCEHQSSYPEDHFGEISYNVCNDCGVLFLAVPEPKI